MLNGSSERNPSEKAGENGKLQNGSGINIASADLSSNLEIGHSPKVVAKVKKARSFMELSNSIVSITNSVRSLRNESKVLVIYTGGTIGMVKNTEGGKFVFNYNSQTIVFVLL